MLAALGIMPTRKAEVHKRIQIGIRNGEDMPTAAAITSIRAAEFLVLLMTKRDAPGPAISSGDVNIGFVNELHGFEALVHATNGPRAKEIGPGW